MHLLDGVHQLLRGCILKHVAAGTQLERAAHVLLFLVHGQHQHAHQRMALAERRRELDAACAGHADVGQHDVGLRLGGLHQCLVGATGLGHHADVRRGFEPHAHAVAHQGMVIHQQHADGRGGQRVCRVVWVLHHAGA
ncbi:hypothetical protein SDC9_163526 [bioreactor metagenome]|uniref:Uncharacterized protein n=1 Tax=bioreactor metagenome TaxID=1076179 RepID=A0A645FP21_9ZZZZ